MTARPNPDAAIRAWLDEEARDGAPERLVEAARRQLERTNQRRAVWPAWRPTPMTTRIAVVAAAIVLAVGAGYLLLPRSNGPATNPSPTPTASPTEAPPLAASSGALAPGRHYFTPFDTNAPGLRVDFTVPSRWEAFSGFALLSPAGTTEPAGSGIGFLTASTLFSDPCHWDSNGTGGSHHVGDLAIGPTASDLASALAGQTAYTTTTPTDTSLGGFQGKLVEVQSPNLDFRANCDKFTGQSDGTYWLWATNEACGCNIYVQGPGERRRMWILDVNGKRIVIFRNFYAGTSAADQAEAQAIIDSIEITP